LKGKFLSLHNLLLFRFRRTLSAVFGAENGASVDPKIKCTNLILQPCANQLRTAHEKTWCLQSYNDILQVFAMSTL